MIVDLTQKEIEILVQYGFEYDEKSKFYGLFKPELKEETFLIKYDHEIKYRFETYDYSDYEGEVGFSKVSSKVGEDLESFIKRVL